ncbi:hypothetical protein V6N12_029789 [Hibiscus sabdariffa]|uniref:Uncharacterized protein n=1 Tax=Hibiscus sabdariffa TaxID=183260 RepID=A0ABR2CXY1_9ROSI
MEKSIVSAVLEKLGSLLMIPEEIKQNVELALALEEEIGKVTVHFQDIQSVLQDAESKQVKDANVRNWLKRLKDIAYDVDDVLDEWRSAKLKPQLDKEEKEAENFPLFKKIRRSISSLTFQTMLYYNIASKIKIINQQLDWVATEKDRYKFELEKEVEEPGRLITASFVDEDEVYGRLEETTVLVNMLVGENDPFDEMRIAKEIIEAFRGECPKLVGKDNILQEIRSCVLGKKMLLVLDDVWTEDATKWEQLKNSLKYCSLGSRILVTTRNEKVAIIMGTPPSNLFLLPTLSQEECWSLLGHKALCGRTREESKNLEDIGRKIAEKCQGLPLAAKILGGLLRFKKTREQWQLVLDSEIWDIEEAEQDLFPPLSLSYYELPLVLKQCISYCVVFPKDTIISKDELIKLWMAQDYLKGVQGEEMEIVGEEYFDELKMRSFFQDFKRDELDSGKLVHLRYLNLKNNRKLKELPESLYVSLMAMPKGIGRLTNLQTLSVFVVADSSSASTLGDLQNLMHLRGLLKISGLGAVCDVAEAKRAELQKKQGLHTLVLDFTISRGVMSRGQRTDDEKVLEALQPPPCLAKLEIWCHSGPTMFPNWMMGLTKLSHISLGSCLHLKSLPPLGTLPSLESLYIGEMSTVKVVEVQFLGVEREEISALPSSLESPSSSFIAFPSLKHLEFFDLKEWECWMPLTIREEEHVSVMPRLCSLTIGSCLKLKSLPHYILQNTSLKELDITITQLLIKFGKFPQSVHTKLMGYQRRGLLIAIGAVKTDLES